MSERDQARLVFHGAIVLFVGNLCGLQLVAALTGGLGEESARAWRVAHSALVAGGIMLIAVGVALRHVVLGARASTCLVASFIALGYGAIVGLGVGAAAGVRGLAPTGPALNLVAFAGNTAVLVGSLIGGMLLICGAQLAIRRSSRASG